MKTTFLSTSRNHLVALVGCSLLATASLAATVNYQQGELPDSSTLTPATNFDMVNNNPGGTQGGGENVMRVGVSDSALGSATNPFRTALVFPVDPAHIPPGEVVTQATLTLHLRGEESSPAGNDGILPSIGVYKVVPGGDLGGDQLISEPQVRWTDRNNSNLWTTEGGDFDPNPLSTLTVTPQLTETFVGPAVIFPSSSSFVTAINEALTGEHPLQLILKMEDEQAAAMGGQEQFARFLSDDSGEPSSRPLLTLVTGLTGDYNNDGFVDAADYVAWRKTNVNGAEGYVTWRSNFGRESCTGACVGSGASDALSIESSFLAVGVPEPSTLLLLAIAACAVLSIHRR